jgi:hypothetical protein
MDLMEQFGNTLDWIGYTIIAAALVFMGSQRWCQKAPISEGDQVTGGKARGLNLAVILGGLALGLIGWLTLAGIIRPSGPGIDGSVVAAPKDRKPGVLDRRRALLRTRAVKAEDSDVDRGDKFGLEVDPREKMGAEGLATDSREQIGSEERAVDPVRPVETPPVPPPGPAPGLEGASRPEAPR